MPLEVRRSQSFERHDAPLYSLTEGRSDKTVFSGGAEGIVAEWDLGTLEPAAFTINVGHSIFSLLTVPEMGWLLIGRGSGSLHVIDLEQRKEIRHLELHRRGIFDIAYDRFMDRFYTAGGDGVLSVLQGKKLQLLRSVPMAEQKLRKLDLDPESGHLAVASGDARVHVIENDMYNEVLTLNAHHPGANAAHFLPDGRTLLSAGRDGHLDIWDRENADEVLHHLPAHYYPIYALVSDPGGRILATASRDKTVKVWDPYEGRFLARLDRKGYGGHTRSVNALHWSKGSGHLVSAGDDARVIVWELDI